MKRSVCLQFMLVIILFLLQPPTTLKLYQNALALEYSVEERIYIVKSQVSHHESHQQQQQQHALPPITAGDGGQQHQDGQLQQQQQFDTTNQKHSQQPSSHNHHPPQDNQPHLQGQLHNHHLQTDHTIHHDLQPQPHPPHSHNLQPHQQNYYQVQQQQQLSQATQQQQQTQQQHQHILHHQQPEFNQQQYNDQQQHQQSLANSMQQVLLDASRQQYLFAHTEIGWKHESTHDGELNEFYMAEFESSSYPTANQDQLAYYQYHQLEQKYHDQHLYHHHHHHHQHLVYPRQAIDDHEYVTQSRQAAAAGSCEPENPSILMQSNPETCQAASLDNPNPTGPSGNVPNFSQPNKPSLNSNVESFPLAHHYHYESSLMSAIRHYWREVSGLCLASAIFLNWLFVIIKRRLVASGIARAEHAIESIQHQATTRSVSKDTNSSSAQDSAFDETASPISLEDIDGSKSSSDNRDKSSNSVQILNASPVMRPRSSTLKAEPISIPTKHTSPGRKNQSPSASLSNSLNTSEYNSRYSSDFHSIQRLGRGGFGIVFEARNKIDDCHYAVKRICLPLEKEARERVMREVRALAKLDHAGIVRYYNAWLETPPEEWLKQHDAQLGIVHSKDGLSFPSTDGIYERNESELITKGGSGGKLGESGDNSSSLFGNSPFKRRPNGFRRFLKNNSSSPSLDIVFEGSGSIRLESENNTEKTDSSEDITTFKKTKTKNGDNNSDSEDSDFIQFESRSNKRNPTHKIDGDELEFSISSHLTEPFSSSDSEADEHSREVNVKKPINNDRKNALNYQKELRQLNNASLVENLHVEKVYLYIQMQLCRKDTLKDWLKTNCEHRDKTIIFDLFYQIVDAVEYVHSQDLIHRDLKPSNIFFSLDGTLKIGDFGLCRAKTSTAGIGSSLDLQEYVAESDVERGFEAVHTEQVGTQLYMSPEQLNGLSYNQKVDVFAMGLILLELLVPFKTQMQRVNVLFKARNNLYSDEFRTDHPLEHELVKSLLNRSPQKRPTATEIKQHDLLASAQLSQPVIERIYHRRRTISSNSSTE